MVRKTYLSPSRQKIVVRQQQLEPYRFIDIIKINHLPHSVNKKSDIAIVKSKAPFSGALAFFWF